MNQRRSDNLSMYLAKNILCIPNPKLIPVGHMTPRSSGYTKLIDLDKPESEKFDQKLTQVGLPINTVHLFRINILNPQLI